MSADLRYLYTMPRSVDEDGEEGEMARYAIAVSVDGWFVLDTKEDVILCWSTCEENALRRRAKLLNLKS